MIHHMMNPPEHSPGKHFLIAFDLLHTLDADLWDGDLSEEVPAHIGTRGGEAAVDGEGGQQWMERANLWQVRHFVSW